MVIDNKNIPKLILEDDNNQYHVIGVVKDLNKLALLRLSDNVKILRSWKNVTENMKKIGYYG